MKKLIPLIAIASSIAVAEYTFPDLSKNNPELVAQGFFGSTVDIDRDRLTRVLQGKWETIIFGHDSLSDKSKLSLTVDRDLNFVLTGTNFDLDWPGDIQTFPIKGKFHVESDEGSEGKHLMLDGLYQSMKGWENRKIIVSLTESDMIIWIGDPPWILKKIENTTSPD